MKKKIITVCVVVILCGFIFKDNLIRSYVSLCHNSLESYAQQMLDEEVSTYGRYGLWKTSAYSKYNMVEFATGGWGLAPSSTYKGFYYSSDNQHKVFSVADLSAVTLETDGDNATWSDGTDNHGSSKRIIDNWFWYEASF